MLWKYFVWLNPLFNSFPDTFIPPQPPLRFFTTNPPSPQKKEKIVSYSRNFAVNCHMNKLKKCCILECLLFVYCFQPLDATFGFLSLIFICAKGLCTVLVLTQKFYNFRNISQNSNPKLMSSSSSHAVLYSSSELECLKEFTIFPDLAAEKAVRVLWSLKGKRGGGISSLYQPTTQDAV